MKRPKYRSECIDDPRPCPWVGCRYHLFLDVLDGGGIKYRFGEDVSALEAMPDTCALDVAERGPLKLHELENVFNVSSNWVFVHGQSARAKIVAYFSDAP